ncbi:MAG: 3-phosphoshikimate 1-carboxyvinyltransferase [Acidimicrobiia bacterium]|nr:3-phosphoshikimate 1-carboxyvinyltransferase [Acidimicrobiia bacterium]
MKTRQLSPPSGEFAASVALPGDKSLSHRALLFSAMAEGTSEIAGLGTGQDIKTTASALAQLGVQYSVANGSVVVTSSGVRGFEAPAAALDCGNSGTTMRLMAGMLAAQPFTSTLVGDKSLSQRPMDRLIEPLGVLGADLSTSADGTPPVTVSPVGGLTGGEVVLTTPSAQLRTAFELAAVQADSDSVVTSPPGYRDHSERWLETVGLGERKDDTFVVHPGSMPATGYVLPGDASSAAFLWAAAAIKEGSEVITSNITLNAGRIGFLEVLERMGAEVDASVDRAILGDPVGTVRVRGCGLRAVHIEGALTIASLDELPLLAIVASFAEGISVVNDATELRVKESDRIKSTCEMVRSLGGGAEATADGFEVVGLGWLDGGEVSSYGDHRIAMAAAVATTGSRGPVRVLGADAASISWPDFYETLEAVWSSR